MIKLDTDQVPSLPVSSNKLFSRFHLKSFFQQNHGLFVHGALLLAQVLWGGMAVWGKAALQQGLHPSMYVFLRLGLSAVMLHGSALAFHRDQYMKVTKKDMLSIFLLSIMATLFTGFFTYGLMLSTATNSVILELTTMIYTAFLTMAVGREKRSLLKILGVFAGAAGGLVMAEIEKFSFSGSVAIGNILLIFQAIFFALYLFFGEVVFKRMPSTIVNSWVNLFASGFHLLASLIFFRKELDIGKLMELPGSAWVSIFYSGAVGTVLAYQLYSWGLRHSSALVASIYLPFQAFSGVILAYLFLGEHFTFRVVLGAGLVVLGVGLVIYTRRSEEGAQDYDKIEINIEEMNNMEEGGSGSSVDGNVDNDETPILTSDELYIQNENVLNEETN